MAIAFTPPFVLFSKNHHRLLSKPCLSTGHPNSSPAARQCPQSEDRADTPGAIFSCFFNLTVTHCLTSLRFYQLLLPWKTKQILSHFRSQIPLVPSNLGHLCSYKIPCLVLTSALQHPRPAPSPPTPPHLLH